MAVGFINNRIPAYEPHYANRDASLIRNVTFDKVFLTSIARVAFSIFWPSRLIVCSGYAGGARFLT